MTTEDQPGPAHSGSARRAGPLSEFLRRGGVILAICTLMGAAAGVLVTTMIPKQYTATSSVLVTATGADASVTANGRTAGVINLDTEAQLVKSAGVVGRAQQSEPLVPRGAPGQVVDHLHVRVPPNTTVLQISFTAATPESAQAAANAFANAYLDDRAATAQSALQAQIDDYNSKADALNKQLRAVTADEQGLPKGSHQLIYDRAQISLLQSQLATLHTSLISLTGTQVTPGRVLTAAPLPTAPSSPKRMLYLGSGLAVGLLAGTLLAWLRVTYRRFARDVSDLERSVDVPTIADVGLSRRNALVDLHSPDAEPYRRLAVVTTSAIGHRGTVVLSATGSARCGGGVAANLAAAIAEAGATVCLLRVAAEFAAGPSPAGVSGVVVDRVETLRARYGGATMRETLGAVRGEVDVLVVDAPCPTQTADAQTLAVSSDAVVMTVESGTRMSVVYDAVDQFDAVAAPMLGIVLMRTPVVRSARRRALLRLLGRRGRGHQGVRIEARPDEGPARRPRPVPGPAESSPEPPRPVLGAVNGTGDAEAPEDDGPAGPVDAGAAEDERAPVANRGDNHQSPSVSS